MELTARQAAAHDQGHADRYRGQRDGQVEDLSGSDAADPMNRVSANYTPAGETEDTSEPLAASTTPAWATMAASIRSMMLWLRDGRMSRSTRIAHERGEYPQAHSLTLGIHQTGVPQFVGI